MSRIAVRIVSGIMSTLSIAWAVISMLISAANFPKDSRDAKDVILRELIDAPHLLPILLAVFCLAALAWAIWWPQKKQSGHSALLQFLPYNLTQKHNGCGDNVIADVISIRKS